MMVGVGRLEQTVSKFAGVTANVLTNIFQHKNVPIKNHTEPSKFENGENYPKQTEDRLVGKDTCKHVLSNRKTKKCIQLMNNIQFDHIDYGLSENSATLKLKQYRLNEIRAKPSKLSIFFHQFKNFSSLSLLGFGCLAIGLGKYIDAGIVFSVIIVSGLISTHYKYKTELAYLEHLNSHHSVMVIRDGVIQNVSPARIVPGDIVYLKPGDLVPADLIALRTNHLCIRELQMDGTYQREFKQALELGKGSKGGSFRGNSGQPHVEIQEESYLYAGSIVMSGTAKGIVAVTGEQTRCGQLLQNPKHRQTFTEKHYDGFSKQLTKIGWVSLLLAGVLVLVSRGSLVHAFQTAASVGTSLIPGGFSLPICLAYWAAIKKTRGNTGGAAQSMHHIDHLEDTKCVIISEHAITDELTVNEFWCGNKQYAANDVIPAPLVQAAMVFTNQKGNKDGQTQKSLYEQAIQKIMGNASPQGDIDILDWEWIDYDHLNEHGFIEMRAFRDENNREIEFIRGPVPMIFQTCDNSIEPTEDFRSIEEGNHVAAQSIQGSLTEWMENVKGPQCALGFAYRIRESCTNFTWIGALAFSRNYSRVNEVLEHFMEQSVPVFLMVENCMTEDSDFWRAISSDTVKTRTLSANDFYTCLEQDTLGSNHSWVIHGDHQQRLTIVERLRERYDNVYFVGCPDQEKPYYGAASLAIEQGVMRGLHDIVDAMKEASEARSRLSRANGQIVSGNIAEALYSLIAGIFGAQHAHGPININIITNMIASIGLAVGGQQNRGTRKAKDIKDLHKPILSRGLVTGIVSTLAYAIGYWIRGDAVFASTFAFTTLILSQLMHALRWGDRDHTEKLSDIAEEGVLMLSGIAALGVLIICVHTPAVAGYFQLTPMAIHEWLAAAALAGGVGPIAAKLEQPLWKKIQGFRPLNITKRQAVNLAA